MTDSAIILCGGQSSRMGSDKAALPFGPDTLLTRVVRAARAVAGDVVIVGDTSQSMPAGVRVVSDPIRGLGPLAALATGLASVGAERSLLVACDMPLLVPAVLRRLLDLTGDADACVPRSHGMPMTTCAVYATRRAPACAGTACRGDAIAARVLDDVSVRWVSAEDLEDLDPGLLSFWDCDTPEHYQAALRQAGLLRAGTNG